MAAPLPRTSTVEAFKGLSARLTGFPAAALDSGFASALWRDLVAAGHEPALAALVAAPELALNGEYGECGGCGAVAVEIIAAWYSGTLPDASGPVAATLHEALIWRTLWFARPPSVCAPRWQAPPGPPAQ